MYRFMKLVNKLWNWKWKAGLQYIWPSWDPWHDALIIQSTLHFSKPERRGPCWAVMGEPRVRPTARVQNKAVATRSSIEPVDSIGLHQASDQWSTFIKEFSWCSLLIKKTKTVSTLALNCSLMKSTTAIAPKSHAHEQFNQHRTESLRKRTRNRNTAVLLQRIDGDLVQFQVKKPQQCLSTSSPKRVKLFSSTQSGGNGRY